MIFDDMEGVVLFASHSMTNVLGLLILKNSVSELENFSIESVVSILTLETLFGLFLYVTAFVISLIILNKFPLSVAVSIMLPLSLITSTFMGYIILDENISIKTIVGIFFIFVGIFFIYLEIPKVA